MSSFNVQPRLDQAPLPMSQADMPERGSVHVRTCEQERPIGRPSNLSEGQKLISRLSERQVRADHLGISVQPMRARHSDLPRSSRRRGRRGVSKLCARSVPHEVKFQGLFDAVGACWTDFVTCACLGGRLPDDDELNDKSVLFPRCGIRGKCACSKHLCFP